MPLSQRKMGWLMESVCAAAEAVTFEDLKTVALPRLMQAFEASFITGVQMVENPALSLREYIPAGLPNPTQKYWTEDYYLTDPIEQLRQTHLKPRVALPTQMVDQKKYKKCAAYQDIFKKFEIEQIMEADLVSASDCVTAGSAAIVLCRSERQSLWTNDEVRLLSKILPAFEAVVRREVDSERFLSVIEGVLDQSDLNGYIALDRRGHILWLSPFAEKLLAPFLGGKRHLPESMEDAAKRLGRLALAKTLLDPPPFSLELRGPERSAMRVEFHLARMHHNGEPYTIAHLLPRKPSLPQESEGCQPSREFLKESFGLTLREAEVTRELMRGKSNLQISKELFISPETVRTHLHRIFDKLGVKTRLQAVVKVSNPHPARIIN